MSLRHAQNQQSTFNNAIRPTIVFTAQCCCKILSNEHANCPSTCFDEEATKQYHASKTNAQRPQTTQKSKLITDWNNRSCIACQYSVGSCGSSLFATFRSRWMFNVRYFCSCSAFFLFKYCDYCL